MAKPGSGVRQDFESDTFVVEEVAPAITTRPYRDGGADEAGLILEPLPFDPTQITHPENRSNPKAGDPAPTLARGGHPPAIAFSSKDDGGDAAEIAPTLRAMGPHGSHPNADGQIAVAYVAPVAGALQSGGRKTPGSATGQDAETGLLVAYVPDQAGSITAAMGRVNGQPQDEAADKLLVAYSPTISGPILAGSEHAGPRTTDIESGALIAQAVNLEHGLAPHGSVELKEIADEITASEGKGHTAILAHAFSMRGRDGENMIEPEADEGLAPAIRTGGGGSDKPFVALAFQERRRPEGVSAEWLEDQSYALTAPTGGGRAQERLVAMAFKPSHFTRDKDGAPSDLAPPLSADADKGDQDPVLLVEDAKAFTVSGQANGFAWESDVNPAILAHPQSDSSQLQYGVRIGTAVRRLTPRECERLQGFEDDFTLIAYSDANRDADDLAQTIQYLRDSGYAENEAVALAATPDGPRYRSLGNSMAVDVIEELGARIEWLLEEGGW